MTPAQPREPLSITLSTALLISGLTFHGLVEGAFRGHFLHDLNLECILAVFSVEECVHIISLVGIADSATHEVAMLEELFSDMAGDIPVHASDEDEGSFGDCLHGI